jgi:hypothetical protein
MIKLITSVLFSGCCVFAADAAIQTPMLSEKAILNKPVLKERILYDISTTAGDTYIFSDIFN